MKLWSLCGLLAVSASGQGFDEDDGDYFHPQTGYIPILHQGDEGSEDVDGVGNNLAYNSEELVDFVNGESGAKWTAGFNSYFDGRLREEAEALMGSWLREPLTEEQEEAMQWAPSEAETVDVPEELDGRTHWPACPSLKESSCGSCWAFGAAEAMTDRLCVASQGRLQTILSSEDLLSCCKDCGDGCGGGEPLAAWQWWVSSGLVSGGNYSAKSGCQPYALPPCEHHLPAKRFQQCPTHEYKTPACERTCQVSYSGTYSGDKHFGASAYNVKRNVAAIQKEILLHGPVEAAFQVYADFAHYKSGVYHHVAGSFMGGHAVKILGWGVEGEEEYWLVANSWNSDWGEGGFFRIRRGADECGIESQVVAGLPKIDA